MTESETVGALLDAAEAVFAQHGIVDASLRAIMRAAGTDPGAIHYHFGGRAELAAAALDRILVPVNHRRLELLARVRSGDVPTTVPSLLDAIVRPDIEIASANPSRGRLLGLVYTRPETFVTELVERRFAPVAARFMPLLAAVLPDVDPAIVSWRVRWVVFGTLGSLLSDAAVNADSAEQTLRQIVTASSAALAATTREGSDS